MRESQSESAGGGGACEPCACRRRRAAAATSARAAEVCAWSRRAQRGGLARRGRTLPHDDLILGDRDLRHSIHEGSLAAVVEVVTEQRARRDFAIGARCRLELGCDATGGMSCELRVLDTRAEAPLAWLLVSSAAPNVVSRLPGGVQERTGLERTSLAARWWRWRHSPHRCVRSYRLCFRNENLTRSGCRLCNKFSRVSDRLLLATRRPAGSGSVVYPRVGPPDVLTSSVGEAII